MNQNGHGPKLSELQAKHQAALIRQAAEVQQRREFGLELIRKTIDTNKLNLTMDDVIFILDRCRCDLIFMAGQMKVKADQMQAQEKENRIVKP